jgi:hypothetical protein
MFVSSASARHGKLYPWSVFAIYRKIAVEVDLEIAFVPIRNSYWRLILRYFW